MPLDTTPDQERIEQLARKFVDDFGPLALQEAAVWSGEEVGSGNIDRAQLAILVWKRIGELQQCG